MRGRWQSGVQGLPGVSTRLFEGLPEAQAVSRVHSALGTRTEPQSFGASLKKMSVDQRWEALYRQSTEQVKVMQNHILTLEQQVQYWMRVAISAQANHAPSRHAKQTGLWQRDGRTPAEAGRDC